MYFDLIKIEPLHHSMQKKNKPTWSVVHYELDHDGEPFLVEVPDTVEDVDDYAQREVYECALSNKDQESVTEIETYFTHDAEYIERLKKESEVINLVNLVK